MENLASLLNVIQQRFDEFQKEADESHRDYVEATFPPDVQFFKAAKRDIDQWWIVQQKDFFRATMACKTVINDGLKICAQAERKNFLEGIRVDLKGVCEKLKMCSTKTSETVPAYSKKEYDHAFADAVAQNLGLLDNLSAGTMLLDDFNKKIEADRNKILAQKGLDPQGKPLPVALPVALEASKKVGPGK